MRYRLNHFFVLIVAVLVPFVAQAQFGRSDAVKLSLLSEVNAIQPGETVYLGLHFELEEHWHIYWKNPGDNGYPVTVDWTLPEGFVAGAIEWPTPHAIPLAGLVTYGFEDQATLLIPLTAPADLKPGQTLSIQAAASWLMCKDMCLPGQADLSLELLSASEGGQPVNLAIFANARALQPAGNEVWALSSQPVDGGLELHIQSKAKSGNSLSGGWYFYADEAQVIDPNAEQVVEVNPDGSVTLRLTLMEGVPAPTGPFGGVLTSAGGSWAVTLNQGEVLPGSKVVAAVEPAEGEGFEQKLLSVGLLGWLVLAFVGGLILNIMPCVLPVLSLKVFSLVKHSGQTRGHALAHGLAYTAGVVGSFLLLAGALFALKALGEGVGWGFQLQSPGFVVVLTMLLFVFGLNMLGVFEIGVGLVGADTKVAQRNDLAGSLGMGVLAAVVGAPCMGPMIASVSGVAIQASVPTGLLLFSVMGLGLASPFLFLAIFPKLAGYLPKPGAWMETFKQSMGFLLILSVVFLAYVLGQQSGVDGIVALLVVLVLCGMAGWIYGRWAAPVKPVKTRRIATVITFLLVIGSGYYGVKQASAARDALIAEPLAEKADGAWATWSEARVEEEVAKGNPVFVDFTASWCLICQANKIATRSDATTALFEKYGIVSLSADWTRRDPKITKLLEQFDRAGVPLYLLYTPDGKVVTLPQSLTNGVIRAAVEQAL